jgi:hypothetical protein
MRSIGSGFIREDWRPAGPLTVSNLRRSVGWLEACAALGRVAGGLHGDRSADPASPRPAAYDGFFWAGAGADPKVVQRILQHASAAMTMDLCGHLIDRNLWEAAQKVRRTAGASETTASKGEAPDSGEKGA